MYPASGQTQGLFQQLANAAPSADQAAIFEGSSALTYDELLELSSRFCDMLGAAGIQPGECVAVLLRNHSQFLVAAFGTWRRGAVLLPLSPQLRKAEILTCLTDSSARAIATTFHNFSVIMSLRSGAFPAAYTWFLLSEDHQWAHEGRQDAHPPARSDDFWQAMGHSNWPAITQYSTGSTGLPKRVTRTHEQLIGEALTVSHLLHLTPKDRVLGAAPFFHSYGLVVSALTTLFSGGTLYPADSFEPHRVAGLIAHRRLTGFPGVPFMFELLCELGAGHDLSSLRFALSAGCPLPASTVDAFEASYGLRIRQLYESTETGVIATSDVYGDVAANGSVGFPLPGVSVAIVDDMGRHLPAQRIGLIRVRSPFAASSYEDPTSCRDSYFTPDSFFPGDLGRLSDTGELTLCDRRRPLINVSGYKVDPNEVQAVLLKHPEIAEAVVLGVDTGATGEALKAVIVSSCFSQQAIRAHCARHLAPFKCPQIIEFRSELPKSPMGKVLRKDLTDDFRARD